MKILGIGGIGGDAASAILDDGVLTAAIEESKISRQKHAGLPQASIAASLKLSKITPEQIDYVALVRPRSSDSRLHLTLRDQFPNSRIALVEHHTAHAASAFFASPFEEATVITLDRAGDLRCGTHWHGKGRHLTLESEFFYP